MRVLIFFSFFFLMLFTTYSQSVFEKAYDFGLELERAGAVLTERDAFIIAGVSTSRIYQGFDAVKLIKIDSVGNIIWQKEAGKSGYEVDFGSSGSLRKTIDGGYILGAGIEDTVNFISDFFLVKFDQFGDTIFTRLHGSNGRDRGYSVTVAKDSGYAIFGQTKGMGDPDGDYYLIKTDSKGNFLWDRTYGGPRLDRGLDIHTMDDGGFLLDGGGEIQGSLFQGYIVRTDSAGNVKWDKTYGNNNETCSTSSTLTKDEGFIFWSCTDSVLSGGYHTYFVAKANTTGNILWEKYYPYTNHHSIEMVRELDSGGYIFCGRIFDPNLNNTRVGWIMLLDKDGNTIWERRYAHLKNSSNSLVFGELHDIQPTSDGGFVAVGMTAETFTGDFWVLKLDSNGCLGDYCGLTDPNCYYQPWPCPIDTSDTTDTIGIAEANVHYSIGHLFPNPTADGFILEYDLSRQMKDVILEINDLIGNRVISRKLNNSQTQVEIKTENLSSNMYVCQVRSNGKTLSIQKLVIIRQ